MNERLNISQVRRMTKGKTWNWEPRTPPQRVTVRCADCPRWHQDNVLVTEATLVYMGHRELKHGAA